MIKIDPNIPLLKCIPDMNFGKEGNDIPDYIKSISCPMSAYREVTVECEIDGDLLALLRGDQAASGETFYVEYDALPELVQIRRHKKKRINKKWAKKCGYNEVLKHCSMKNCYIELKGEGI